MQNTDNRNERNRRAAGLYLAESPPLMTLLSGDCSGLASKAIPPAPNWRHVTGGASPYFCQVRFLCRLARNCFRRLCLLIFALRRFFSEPIRFFNLSFCLSVNYFVQRILNDSFSPGGLELRD